MNTNIKMIIEEYLAEDRALQIWSAYTEAHGSQRYLFRADAVSYVSTANDKDNVGEKVLIIDYNNARYWISGFTKEELDEAFEALT
jgi:hypothetical protein